MTIDSYMVVNESPARIVKVKPRIFCQQLGSAEPSSEEDSCKANFGKCGEYLYDEYATVLQFKSTCEILVIDS